jgi:ABC-type transport system involved in multi-copper enzyme maturation permease subunit
MIWLVTLDTLYGFWKAKLVWGLGLGLAVAAALFILFFPYLLGGNEMALFIPVVFQFGMGLLGSILALMIFGYQIPSRIEGMEIGVYLSRPISRFEFLTGRIIGSLLFLLAYAFLSQLVVISTWTVTLKEVGKQHLVVWGSQFSLNILGLFLLGVLSTTLFALLRMAMLGLEVLFFRMLGFSGAFSIITSYCFTSALGTILISSYGKEGLSGRIGEFFYLVLPDRGLLNNFNHIENNFILADFLKVLVYGLVWILFFFSVVAHRYQARDMVRGDGPS